MDHYGLNKNYKRDRFSRKPTLAQYTVPQTKKKILRLAETSLGEIFRLILVQVDHYGLNKNYERDSLSRKTTSAQYTVP